MPTPIFYSAYASTQFDGAIAKALVAEAASNKVVSLSALSSDVQYPSAKVVYDQLTLKMTGNTAITAGTGKTKVSYDAKGLVTAGSDATTADIADGLNKRYVTDAHLTLLGNTSGTNSGDNAVNSNYSGLVTNATHTGEVTGSGALTIAAKAVTLAKMADIDSGTLLYRKSAGAGAPETQAIGTVKTDLGLSGTNSGDNAANLSSVAKGGDTMTGPLVLMASTLTQPPLHIPQGVRPTSTLDGDIWSEARGVFFQNNAHIHQMDTDTNSVGMLSKVAVTSNGNGTVNVGSADCFLYSIPGWDGDYSRFTVPALANVSLVEGVNYLVVSQIAGSATYSVVQSTATVNNSNVLLAALMWRSGNDIHSDSVNWGLATASRLNDRLINIQRYVRSSGLMIGETTGRVITVTSGLFWYGISAITTAAVTSAADGCEFWYHVSGVWTKSLVTTYNNNQYDNGTNLVTLNGAGTQYAVNWVYRYVDGEGLPKLAYVIGRGNYSQTQATDETAPTTVPPILSNMAMLVGKIVVAQAGATAYSISSAFTMSFSGTSAVDHNDTANIQGGSVDNYYHFTAAQHAALLALIPGI